MTRIILVNPPSPFLISERVMPPLGIMYLSSVLKEAGHQVQMANGGEIPDDADVVGITATTAQFLGAAEIASAIKKRNPRTHIVLGGPHATCFKEQCLSGGFDQIIVGEGERAILKVVEGSRQRIIREPQIENLDEIPFPDREDVEDYSYSIDGEPCTTMMTSRGCPFHCAFCTKTWSGIRFRSPPNVLAEAKVIREDGFSGILLYDDEMLLRKRRDAEIFRGFKELGFVWRCFTRSDLVDDKMARLMAECGCREVLLGIESGSDSILKTINKGTTRAMNLKAIAILKKHGIRVKVLLMIGLPGETHETISSTESFVEEAQPDDVDFTIFTPFPLSDIYENRERYDIQFDPEYFLKTQAWFKGRPGHYASAVSTSGLTSSELVEERGRLEKKFKRWN